MQWLLRSSSRTVQKQSFLYRVPDVTAELQGGAMFYKHYMNHSKSVHAGNSTTRKSAKPHYTHGECLHLLRIDQVICLLP